eukprot:GHUV01047115.1.p1 GENE.GHUV01047115.1~~GHUV01047115.1.p1  ORF type:complete len:139 (-),score=18.22 GHUV01047115.1:740-1156(-)
MPWLHGRRLVQSTIYMCVSCHVQCDWFVEVTWVDANGDIHTSVKGTEDAKALCGGIGLLGVIAEITLQMKPTTNSWFKTWYLKDDAHLAEDIEAMLKVGVVYMLKLAVSSIHCVTGRLDCKVHRIGTRGCYQGDQVYG